MKATRAPAAGTAGILVLPASLEHSLALGALCALLSGCAANPVPTTPAWPEQPSPSYPDPSGEHNDESGSDDLADEAPVESKTELNGPPASTLAKMYDGKSALETLRGKASYYADSLAGNHTANGDVYDPKLFTAAHKTLEFGTVVRVARVDTGAVTYATVNDRGPFGDSTRIIDLSKAAAQELNMMKAGLIDVRVEVVNRPEK
jgi:rare lipoprotein A